jgi:hypothetical protein
VPMPEVVRYENSPDPRLIRFSVYPGIEASNSPDLCPLGLGS